MADSVKKHEGRSLVSRIRESSCDSAAKDQRFTFVKFLSSHIQYGTYAMLAVR